MPQIVPVVAGDVTARTVSSATGALPWPLSVIAGALIGDRLEAIKQSTHPNPYTTAPSSAQLGIAQLQAHRAAVRGGFSGLAGSTERWDHDQDIAPGLAATGLRQDLTTMAIAPSRLLPYTEQGHPRDANTTRGYTGPVITPSRLAWGWSTRFRFPRIIAGTLLPPEARTPTPREMASAYVEHNPTMLRLTDPYDVAEDMEDWG